MLLIGQVKLKPKLLPSANKPRYNRKA